MQMKRVMEIPTNRKTRNEEADDAVDFISGSSVEGDGDGGSRRARVPARVRTILEGSNQWQQMK